MPHALPLERNDLLRLQTAAECLVGFDGFAQKSVATAF